MKEFMKESLGAYIGVIWLFLVAFCVIGYAKNIYKLTQCDFEEPYKAEVIHAVGIVPIVGAVTGWMDFGE